MGCCSGLGGDIDTSDIETAVAVHASGDLFALEIICFQSQWSGEVAEVGVGGSVVGK